MIFYVAVFKEYTQVQTDEHGAPKTDELGVYFYECYKFPGYYIHWNHDRSVDCEVSYSVTMLTQVIDLLFILAPVRCIRHSFY